MRAISKVFTIFTSRQLVRCGLIICSMVIGAILEAIGIGVILPLISIMGNGQFLLNHPSLTEFLRTIGINSHGQFIIIIASLLILLYVLKNIYMVWQAKLQIDFSMKSQIYYSERLFLGYLNKPYSYHLDHNTAGLLRNVNNAGIIIFSTILISVFSLLAEIITAVTIWLMLVVIDPFSAIVVAGAMGTLLLFIIKIFRKKIAKQGQIQNEYAAEYIKWINQGLGAIKETKILNKERFFFDEFSRAYCKYGNANRKFMFLNQLPRMLIESIVVSGMLFLIIVKLLLGNSAEEIVPFLGVLALASFRLMPSANRIVNFLNTIKFQMPLFDELYQELIDIKKINTDETVSLLSKNNVVMEFEKEIKIDRVEFQYNETSKKILKGVTFIIPKGSFVGVVGSSGAGKTTFVDVLLGLLTPTAGRICVDGVDVQTNIRGWQENIAYVPQNIYLIDGTIKENIALGVELDKIDNNMLEKVLEMAELQEFVFEQESGIETSVGERGVKLSGGQRQRIGIARALYRKPQFLIFDEATSALDSETEKSITNTILNLKGKITIIAVAHRLSTLEECDFKVQFDRGKCKILNEY